MQCARTLFPYQISRLHRMAHRVSSSTENSSILQKRLKTVGTAQSVWCLDYELHETGFISWQDKGIFSSPKRPEWLRDTPILLFNGCRKLFRRELSGWGMKLTAQGHLVPRFRMSGAILPLPRYAFSPQTGTTRSAKQN